MINKLSIMLIMLLFFSCDENGSVVFEGEQVINSSIRGYVYDKSGEPVSNAYIFLGYEFVSIDRPSTTLSLSLPVDMIVNIWVENKCNQLVSTLVNNETMIAGMHDITWNAINSEGLRLSDGAYNIYATAGYESHSQTVILRTHLEDEYDDCTDEDGNLMCETITTTNSNGYFEFSQDCLSFGVITQGTDEFGEPSGTITIENKLMLFADDGQNYGLTGLFEVHPETGAEINIYIDNE